MIKKAFFWIIIFWLISLWISCAYAPFKADRTCDINEQEDPDGFWKEQCENEMSFEKFTEVTGTREMSTTCCGYIDHTPGMNFVQEKIKRAWWVEKLQQENRLDEIRQQTINELESMSEDFEKIRNLLFIFSTQIYNKSEDKLTATKRLSNLFKSCTKWGRNIKFKAVCWELYYDFIWTNPKISEITFDEILETLKWNKFIKRGIQYSDLVENYTPIIYRWWSINSMYMAGDYALGLMDGHEYFNSKEISWMRIMVLKAGDTHRQDFAKINWNIDYLRESYLYYNKNNLYLVIWKELRDNVYKKEWVLKWEYRLNNDKTRDFVDCYLEKDDGKWGISKIKDNRCSSEIWATITTIL